MQIFYCSSSCSRRFTELFRATYWLTIKGYFSLPLSDIHSSILSACDLTNFFFRFARGYFSQWQKSCIFTLCSILHLFGRFRRTYCLWIVKYPSAFRSSRFSHPHFHSWYVWRTFVTFGYLPRRENEHRPLPFSHLESVNDSSKKSPVYIYL